MLPIAVHRGVRVRQRTAASTGVIGDSDGFAELIRPHFVDMSRFAQRLVGDHGADDVLQEALASAWRSRHRFDARRGTPRAWLLAIVANEAHEYRRAVGKNRQVGAEVPADQHAGRTADEALALDVTAALERLSHRQRAVVALHYYLGFSVADCSEVLGCSDGTVKSTLSDARRRLRAILGEDYR